VLLVLLTIDLTVAIIYFATAETSASHHRSNSTVAADFRATKEWPNAPFKRRDLLSADELSRQLVTAPEVDLDTEVGTSERLVEVVRNGDAVFTHPVFEPLLKRADLHGLPLAMGAACRIGKDSAENLDVLSRKLRDHMSKSLPLDKRDSRIEATILWQLLAGEGDEWQQVDALPALVQMLQAENRGVRLLLVRQLSKIKDPAASAALASRAVFDLSADVREAAVMALRDRPREEYRQLLLDGLRYPWAPAADHAAEALVALGDRESIGPLVVMLGEPDPTGSTVQAFHDVDRSEIYTPRFAKESPLSLVALTERHGSQRRTALLTEPPVREAPVVREVVRINHLRNCLLCHEPSVEATDLVRGFVPSPREPLPPLVEYYNRERSGNFVRADVTYLRQDFSIPQPVANNGPWPAYQRYDYVVRTRYATEEESRRLAPRTYPQREAVRWALRELSGLNGG
jgi:hypothetical protein